MNQTNPFFFTLKSLCSPFILSYFLFFSLLTRITLCSVNPKFEACQPKTCGNGQIITYPFYIEGQQEAFCGFPRLGLSCKNGFPMLNLSTTFYIVQEIFYTNQSLRVSNPAFSNFNSSNCLSPPTNLTLYGHKLNFARKQKELFLFFNCTLPVGVKEYRIGCSAGNKTGSVLAMDNEGKNWTDAWKNCTGGVVKTMVEEGYRVGGEGIGEALRRGFVLNWTVTECSQCEMSGGKCGFDMKTYSFRCFCRDRDYLWECHSGNKALKLGLGLGLGLGIGFPSFLIIGIVLWCYKRKYAHSDFRFQSRNAPHSNSDLEGSNVYYGVPVFSYRELEAATNSFDHTRELGDGGFGTVYYGKLRDGREVAVKRLYEQNYRRVQQFMNEVKILTRLRHTNLVSLYGCTSRHSRELLLVYEYIPNGTVAYHLHLHADTTKPNLLPWSIRMKIAIETASALSYLHASDIIHRDVKTNNILLDNSFCVKVVDFGLSRLFPNNVTHVSTAPQGTPGYVDPEYHHYYQLTSKSDVYSFGVVLIELISSMAAVDMSRDRDDINLSSLAIRKIQKSELTELVDPNLGFGSDSEVRRMIVSVAQLAFQCLQGDKELRPSMDEVLEVLRRIESGKVEPEQLEKEGDDGGGGVSESDAHRHRPPLPVPTSPNWDEVGLLKNMTITPPSPNTVTDKWESKSTTPNISV